MRTDIHAEKSLKPENYRVIEYLYTKAPAFVMGAGVDAYAAAMRAFQANMERVRKMLEERGAMIHGGWSNCDHCGAYYHHGVLLEHIETQELITVGWICAENRFDLTDIAWHRKRLEKVLKQVKHRRGKWAKLRTFGRENRDALRALNRYGRQNARSPNHTVNGFLASLREQLLKRGMLSDRQTECIEGAAERAAKWAAERAARKVEQERNAKPCPRGRVEIRGAVVSTRVEDSAYNRYGVVKMLVQADGFRVWGTAPDSLLSDTLERGGLKGAKIVFSAAVTPSDKDKSFGFFKRPTKARVIDNLEE